MMGRDGGPTTRVGVISDTHGLLRAEALEALEGSELIIHAGDIGSPVVLDGLRTVGPVVAIRGNIDTDEWAASLPATETVEVGEAVLHVLHDVGALDLDPVAAGFRAIIAATRIVRPSSPGTMCST
jgi:uncharacterized protein